MGYDKLEVIRRLLFMTRRFERGGEVQCLEKGDTRKPREMTFNKCIKRFSDTVIHNSVTKSIDGEYDLTHINLRSRNCTYVNVINSLHKRLFHFQKQINYKKPWKSWITSRPNIRELCINNLPTYLHTYSFTY